MKSLPLHPHRPLAIAMAAALGWAGISTVHASPAVTGGSATVAQAAVLRRGDTVMGALPANAPVHIVLALPLRNRAALDAFVANGGKPASAGERWMTSDEVLANHAPTPEQARAVADYLRGMGFRNIEIAPNRLLVSADGSALIAGAAFQTRFVQVKTVEGRVAFANAEPARLPAALAGKVGAVLGLQTVHQGRPASRRARTDGVHTELSNGHFPTEFPAIYGGAGSVVASGVTVGILTEGNITQSKTDLKTFATQRSLAPVANNTVNTNGTSTDTTWIGEWDLDSQDIVGMAGGSVGKLIFYNIPSLLNTDMVADFNTMVAANAAKIINVSIQECASTAEADGSGWAADQIFALGVAQGQTFSVATGDHGADECPDDGSSALIPSWPAESPYVVAVAGTTLSASTTTWGSEVVWNTLNGGFGATGGSESIFGPKPSWQKLWSGFDRGVADLSFDGDPNTGAYIVLSGKIQQWGGTSLAAPLFAGVWARVLQLHPKAGFAGPAIYNLPAADFHDVTSGNNGGEAARVGYDLASGRGSMIIAKMLADIVPLVDQPPVANFSVATNALTATFTDKSTDSDGTIVAHAWNFGDGTTSTAASPTHTYLVQGTFNATETVTDDQGVHGHKTVAVKTVWPAGTSQLLQNPGFESGVATPWTISPGVLLQDAASAFAGNWYARIGARYPAQTVDHIQQSVAIPAGIRSAALEFRMRVTTAETGTAAHDRLTVSVNNAAGTQLARLATFSNLDATSGYVLHACDLTPYIGQTITIKLQGSNDATLPTGWAIDNVFVESVP